MPMNHAVARVGLIVTAIVAVLIVHHPAVGQVLYGSIIGNVKDSSDAGVAGATVVATNMQTGQVRQSTANDLGIYSFSTVQGGSYAIKVSKAGFATFTQSDIPVAINSIARVDVVLTVGAVSESVTVAAGAEALQVDRAEVRAEITSKAVVELPGSINRNYQYLLNTVPGVTPAPIRANNPSNPTGSSIFNVNGASNQVNNTRIDGASAITIWQPQYVAYNPPLEAIETVNVVTNTYDAEQGLAGGAAINVVLKSGTNQFHGSLFEYYHNHHMGARNYFLPASQQIGKYLLNQYGGTMGGPIKRDKLFFFTSFENSTDRRNQNTIASVPSQAVRTGNMSAYPLVYDPLTGNPDASARTPFPNNVVPQARMDPIVQKIIPLIPIPNLGGETNNYFASGRLNLNRWAWDTKSNWNITDRSALWARFSWMSVDYLDDTIFSNILQGPAIDASNPGLGGTDTYNVSAGFTHTFTPRLVMDTNLGYVKTTTGNSITTSAVAQNSGLNFLGIPGTNGPAFYQAGFPHFQGTGYSNYGTDVGYSPYWRWDSQQQMVANLTWARGAHEVRWGADIYRQAMNHTQPEGPGYGHGPRGDFVFSSGPTLQCTKPDGKGGCLTFSTSSTAASFADFLLGDPIRIGKNMMTEYPFSTRQWEYSFYIRDKWQIGRKLTLSYGTRWEYYPVPTRANRGVERYDPQTNLMQLGGLGGIPTDLGVKVSKKLFAPRFGLAYRATNTLVIRGGYGISIDPYSMARSVLENYPIIVELDQNSINSWQPMIFGLSQGIPPIPVPDTSKGLVPVSGAVGLSTMSGVFQRGYIQSWNMTVQKEFPRGFVAELGYVASRQIRQQGSLQLNWAPIGTGVAGQQLNQQFGRTASTKMLSPIGNTHYDSMQARLRRRFSSGVGVEVAYTWGKSITDSGQDNSDGTANITIPQYYALNRSVSSFDRTQNLQITYIAELPFGKGKRFLSQGGILSSALGGWQLNGYLAFYSGLPFSVTASGTSLNAPNSTQRADQVTPTVKILGGTGLGQPYFDPLAFAPVNDPRFGTAGFLSMRGPGVVNWDGGVFRNFQLKERVRLQCRFEALNVTNTPHFANPAANVSNLQLNADGSVKNLNGYDVITSATGERMLRVGLRVSF